MVKKGEGIGVRRGCVVGVVAWSWHYDVMSGTILPASRRTRTILRFVGSPLPSNNVHSSGKSGNVRALIQQQPVT